MTTFSELEEKIKKINLPDKNLLIREKGRFFLFYNNYSCGVYKNLEEAFKAITIYGVGNGSGSFIYLSNAEIKFLLRENKK